MLAHRLMQPLIIVIGFATRLGVSCPSYTEVRLHHLKRYPRVIIDGRFIWPTAGGLFANGRNTLWSFSEQSLVASYGQVNGRISFQLVQLSTSNVSIVRPHIVFTYVSRMFILCFILHEIAASKDRTYVFHMGSHIATYRPPDHQTRSKNDTSHLAEHKFKLFS